MQTIALETGSDIGYVRDELFRQLDDGIVFPVCRVDGPFFDRACADIETMTGNKVPQPFGEFSVWDTARLGPDVEALIKGVAEVSLHGFSIYNEEDVQSYICGARSAASHRDNGNSHIVNVTQSGRRLVTVRDENGAKHQRDLTRGSISVIRTYQIAGPYVNCLPHEVELVEPGHFLQVTHRNRRFDLDVVSRPV